MAIFAANTSSCIGLIEIPKSSLWATTMNISYKHNPGGSFAETFYPSETEEGALLKGKEMWNKIEASGFKIKRMRIGLEDIIVRIEKA